MSDEPHYDFNDPTYCYEGTDVLRNRLNIRDTERLSEAETSFTLMRMMELDKNPVNGKFDIDHLKEIHRRLFSDIYDWAGEFRTVEISKGIPFCMCANIQGCLEKLLSELRAENYLRDIDDRETMVKRLAYYLAELNVIHPFRESNGRAQRKFIEQIAREAGFELNFDGINSEEMAYAGKKSMICDYEPMEAIIRKSLSYTMTDVMDYAYGKKTSGAVSWEGHARAIMGEQIERQSKSVFNIPLENIREQRGFKTPDLINVDCGVCVEVFSGTSRGRVTDVISGIPMVTVRKNTALNHLITALRHAKGKFNDKSEKYLRSAYHVNGRLYKIAMCSMDFTDYIQVSREAIVGKMKTVNISDYGVDAFVVYFLPAGLSDHIYGGDVFVFYENDIDTTVFKNGTEFIRNH